MAEKDCFDYASMGMEIRRSRKLLKLTQKDLADKIGLSVSFVGHIERGSRKASIWTLYQICDELGMSSDILLGLPIHDPMHRIEIKRITDELVHAVQEKAVVLLSTENGTDGIDNVEAQESFR